MELNKTGKGKIRERQGNYKGTTTKAHLNVVYLELLVPPSLQGPTGEEAHHKTSW